MPVWSSIFGWTEGAQHGCSTCCCRCICTSLFFIPPSGLIKPSMDDCKPACTLLSLMVPISKFVCGESGVYRVLPHAFLWVLKTATDFWELPLGLVVVVACYFIGNIRL